MRHSLLAVILWIAAALGVRAAEVMPPKPARWFNDYAGVVPAGTIRELDAKLEQFERDTSNQIVVAVWRDMQSDSSVQDYTFRIFQQWKLGQRDKNNGIGLFVFVAPRKMFMQVGYGLEGAVPDAIAKRIIEDEIAPHFKTGDYGAGLTAGVDAILAAAKGEYKGTGRTAGDTGDVPLLVWVVLFFIALNVIASVVHYMRRGLEISGKGRRWQSPVNSFPTILHGGGSSWGGSGGWGSGGGGGGFSGGGGRSGGGGAGGSW